MELSLFLNDTWIDVVDLQLQENEPKISWTEKSSGQMGTILLDKTTNGETCLIKVGTTEKAKDAPYKFCFYLHSPESKESPGSEEVPGSTQLPLNFSTNSVQHMRDIKRYVNELGEQLLSKSNNNDILPLSTEGLKVSEGKRNESQVDQIEPSMAATLHNEREGLESHSGTLSSENYDAGISLSELARPSQEKDMHIPANDINPPSNNGDNLGSSNSEYLVLPVVDPQEEKKKDSRILNVRVEFDKEIIYIQIGLDELEQLTVADLKSSICFKLSAKRNLVIRPENLNLFIRDAPLRNHWTCSEIFLHQHSVLRAEISKAHSKFRQDQSNPIFSLHVELHGRVETIHVRNGDIPELLATAFARMNGLDSAYVPPLVAEIYRGLSKALAAELRILQGELLQNYSTDASKVDIEKGREMLLTSKEEMVESANAEIKRLEEENQYLRNQLQKMSVPKR